MATCLGISTENNITKYAKLNVTKDAVKVESFGIKFNDNLEAALKEIVEETDSHNIPICMNLTDEMYNYFTVFNMLAKKDIEALLNSEFELLCEDKGYNLNTLDSKYLLTDEILNKEQSRVIYVSCDKMDITSKMQRLKDFKISEVIPLSISLVNLVKASKENYAIINIEEDTKITTVVNNQVYDVSIIDSGMKEILSAINLKENSMQKAYEVCKNTTIYTMETSEMQLVENLYLQDIMPVLYKIITAIKDKFENDTVNIRKLYITGSAAIINNIDLYFQEYLPAYKCQILVPYFIDKNSHTNNVKDYIEVNSAISVAFEKLLNKKDSIAFKNYYLKNSVKGKSLKETLNSEIKLSDIKNFFTKTLKSDVNLKEKLGNVDFSLKGNLTQMEQGMIHFGIFGIACTGIYGGIATHLQNEFQTKIDEAKAITSDTQVKISQINKNVNEINQKKITYTNRTKKLQDLTNQVIENNKYKKAIPILLNRIMSVVPRQVKVTSIENNVEGKIIINAQAKNYDDLGYFKARLKTDNILYNVTSDSSVKSNGIVRVTIEGDLP